MVSTNGKSGTTQGVDSDPKKVETATMQGKEVTREMVRQWVHRDIVAASYFLSMLLKYRDVQDELGDLLFDKAMRDTQGSPIDKEHVDADRGNNSEK